MYKTIVELLPGACALQVNSFEDERGSFVKTFHKDALAEAGISFRPAESFYSVSKRGVLRGMHFQLPPHDHGKLVCCMAGRIVDVLVDLRVGSPMYRHAVSCELAACNPMLIYIPPGVGHGFFTLEENSLVTYITTSAHTPSHDAGVRWDTIGIKWPTPTPILSRRDASFPPLANFTSPFRYNTNPPEYE